MSIFYSVVFEGVDVSKITVDFWDEIFLSFFLRGGGRDVLDEERPRFLRQRRWRRLLSSGQNKTQIEEDDDHYFSALSSSSLDSRRERERERERRAHDATTRGSNARRIATMTAAEDVPTRPLTEYIFGFFSL